MCAFHQKDPFSSPLSDAAYINYGNYNPEHLVIQNVSLPVLTLCPYTSVLCRGTFFQAMENILFVA